MFTKKEIFALIFSLFILSFVFGFDDGTKKLVLNTWLFNFFKIFVLVTLAVFVRELAMKLHARTDDALVEYELWGIRRVWFTGNGLLHRPLYLGTLIAILMTLSSKGAFFFTALGNHKITERGSARVGRRLTRLNYSEEAQIISAGIFANIFLAILGIFLGRIFHFNAQQFVNINFYLILFNLFPLSNLDGAKLFFGSLLGYIFMLVFFIVTFFILKISIVLALILAILLACFATFFYFYKYIYT